MFFPVDHVCTTGVVPQIDQTTVSFDPIVVAHFCISWPLSQKSEGDKVVDVFVEVLLPQVRCFVAIPQRELPQEDASSEKPATTVMRHPPVD
jgi:hypothetical protein